MKTYSLYEIFRRGLLKKPSGEAYKDKAAVSRIVRLHLKHTLVKGDHGMSRQVPLSEIQRWNRG